MTNLEGQTFAGYEIVSKLGQGGMGAVYKARQPLLNRIVALKVMAPDLAADPDFVARFIREAASAANLRHPNIVEVFTAGEQNGVYYMAMEFIEGESLRKRLDRLGRLTPKEAIAITIYVAQALQYAWNETKLIHRDIKPDNVFLSNKGEVKVGDLGLAKSVGTESTELTQSGVTMGSPHYISPEQVKASKDTDFRTDIYSLGCTLYHMLTGETPYQGDSSMVVMLKHVNNPPPAIFKTWPACPMPLGMLVGKMLAKDRNARPQSYEQLVADLFAVSEKLQQPAAPAPPPVPKPTPAASAKPPAPSPATATVTARSSAKSKNMKAIYAAAGAAAIVALGGLFLWSPWKVGEAEPGSESRLQAEAVSQQPAKAGTPNAAASLQYGLYYHFDISTFSNSKDQSLNGNLPLSTYAPKALDVRQWVRVAREAGASFAVLSAKYEAGFCLWPAKDHDYNVGLTPVKTDVVQEFVAACKAEGITAGVQYSIPDAHVEGRANRNGPVSAEYFQTIRKHLAELTANYPGILIYKLYYGERLSPAQLSELIGLLKQSNPNRIILLTALGQRDRPGIQEHNVATVNEGWTWSPNCKLTPTPKLLQKYQESVQQNRPLLMNVGPDRDGRIPDEFVGVLTALKSMMGIPAQPAPAADAASQNAINLLPLIDPQKDAAGGKWTWGGNTLVSDPAQNGRIAIPYRPPQEYDYRLVFHHTKGYTPTDAGQVIQILSKDGRLFSWIMGAKKGEFLGFETVAGANSADQANPTIIQRKPALKKNVTYTSLVEVRNDGLKAYLNGEMLAQHKTDYKDMDIVPHWKLPDPTLLGVGSWLTAMVIEKIEVREITGKGTFTRGAPASAAAEKWTTLPNGWRFGNPVNLGPIVNGAAGEMHPTVSGDGLILLFASDRAEGGVGGSGIWACTRPNTTASWGTPHSHDELRGRCSTLDPWLSADGLTLVFSSTRSGFQRKHDLHTSTRRNTAEPWGKPANLGPRINSEFEELAPFLSADGLTLLFLSDRPKGIGARDIWMSTRPDIGASWSEPLNLGPTVNSQEDEDGAYLSADNLALFFASSRSGGHGKGDLWMSTRRSKTEPFGEPVNLGATVNTRMDENGPFLSTDNRTLYFHSNGPGGQGKNDLWQVPVLPPDAPSSPAPPITNHQSPITPALAAFCAEVAALPAEQQVARVVAKLKELNPDFDGKEKHKIEASDVVELEISALNVTDISPVQALKKLRRFMCIASTDGKRRSKLSDLMPLQGLSLTELRVPGCDVSDLSPVRGMPLHHVGINYTLVTDLSPLQGAPVDTLNCQGVPIRDLSPLRGAPLRSLMCDGTLVTDLSPLRDSPLEILSCDAAVSASTANQQILRAIPTLKTIKTGRTGRSRSQKTQ